jgi:hypothetical protein
MNAVIFLNQMTASGKLIFKIADTPEEKEQVYQLGYETFVEEIPQHAVNESRRLVDRFDQDNIYFVCQNESGEIVGMVCVRDKRPFSLDEKLGKVESLLPAAQRLCEIRLLAVRAAYRHTAVFYGLVNMLFGFFVQKGFDMAIISGTSRQQKLYRRMGFVPFAHPVGTPDALYYPMYLGLQEFMQHNKAFALEDEHHELLQLPL